MTVLSLVDNNLTLYIVVVKDQHGIEHSQTFANTQAAMQYINSFASYREAKISVLADST